MTDKLTDNEIKKALEKHYKQIEEGYGNNLAFGGKRDFEHEKYIDLISGVIDLINRKDQENENLKAEVERLKNLTLEKCCDNCVHEEKTLQADPCCECFNYRNFTPKNYLKQIKAEAYKKCIEKVKEKSKKTEVVASGALIAISYAISAKNLDNLLNELVGDNNV